MFGLVVGAENLGLGALRDEQASVVTTKERRKKEQRWKVNQRY